MSAVFEGIQMQTRIHLESSDIDNGCRLRFLLCQASAFFSCCLFFGGLSIERFLFFVKGSSVSLRSSLPLRSSFLTVVVFTDMSANPSTPQTEWQRPTEITWKTITRFKGSTVNISCQTCWEIPRGAMPTLWLARTNRTIAVWVRSCFFVILCNSGPTRRGGIL